MKPPLRSLLAILLGTALSSIAQPVGPGWHDIPGPPPRVNSPSSPPSAPGSAPPPAPGNAPPASEALAVTPEIVELAGGLLGDPVRIYNFVRNEIGYVPYAGSLKGATLTLLDREGNDFDQASLLIALLRESGFTARYKFGTMDIPASDPSGNDAPTWLGVDLEQAGQALSNGGNDVTTFVGGDGNPIFFRLRRAWVELEMGGSTYLLDPSFKRYEEIQPIDLDAAVGYDRADFLAAADGTSTADYVQNMDGPAFDAKLREYAGNLVDAIRSDKANATVPEIIGGRAIVKEALEALPTDLPFDHVEEETWSEIPITRTASVRLQLGSIDLVLPTDGLAARRLSLTFDSTTKRATIWLDDQAVAQETGNVSGQTNVDLTLTVDHPYETTGAGAFADQFETKSYERDGAYAILYAFGGSKSGGHLRKRQRQLDQYRAAGLADDSREVLTETLNTVGLAWMKQTSLASEVMNQLAEVAAIRHHRFGRFGQEQGYYVDVGTQFQSSTSKRAGSDADDKAFRAGSFFASAMEHAVIEQLQDNASASTVKMFDLAINGGDKIFYADSSNFDSVWAQIRSNGGANSDGYPDGLEGQFRSIVGTTPTGILILPEKYTRTVGSWRGTGYVTYRESAGGGRSQGMIISGGYSGGFAGDPGMIYPPLLVGNYQSGPGYSGGEPPGALNPLTSDPIDLATGAYYVEKADLLCGLDQPRGLAFARYYNSNENKISSVLGNGWTHSYEGKATVRTDIEAALGETTPVDMTSFVAGVYVALDLMEDPDSAKDWVAGALACGWAVDLLDDNAVSVTIGRKSIQFLKLADGSYNPAAGLRMQLKEADGRFVIDEHLTGQVLFDDENRLSALRDIDGNELTVEYDGSSERVSTVTDHYGRTLTFAYDPNERLESVQETAGPLARSIQFTYDGAGNLEFVENAEGHRYKYAYDDDHRMTALWNPAGEYLAINEYDDLGRVWRQHIRGFDGSSAEQSPNHTWHFYYSGPITIEEDPLGNRTTYHFDAKGREISRQTPLGHRSFREYDGQGHVVKTIDAEGNETLFTYETAYRSTPTGAPGAHHNMRSSTYTVDGVPITVDRVYDEHNRLQSQTDGEGNRSEITYYPNHRVRQEIAPAPFRFATEYSYYMAGPHKGLPQAITDPNGNQTIYSYDDYGNTDLVTREGGVQTDHDFSPRGDLLQRTDAEGRVTSYAYDERRLRTRQTIDPGGFAITRETTYDENGHMSSMVGPSGIRTDFEYDAFGKPLSVIAPNQGRIDYDYDRAERQIATTNPRGQTTRKNYDAEGRQTRVISPVNDFVGFGYDGNNNVRTVTNEHGQSTTIDYNELNLPVSLRTPRDFQTRSAYDRRGFLETLTEPSGEESSYLYDEAGRLAQIADPLGAVTHSYEYGIIYDGAKKGFRHTVSEEGKSLVRQYDQNGRLYSFTDQAGQTISYEYLSNGLLRRVIYPGGTRAVTYSYDSANRMETVTDWSDRVTSYQYYPAGHPNQTRLQSITRPNGTKRVLSYNAVGELTGIREETSTGATICDYRLVHDSDGNIVAEVIDPVPQFAPPAPAAMSYDADNRLVSFNGQALAFDEDANLTTGPLANGSAALAYDARNRLVSAGGQSYEYDSEGRRTALTEGAVTTSYLHNPNAPLSQLLSQTREEGATSATTSYVYGAEGLLYQVDPDGNAIYHHYDLRGSTVALTDHAQNVTARIDYFPYGGIARVTGSAETPFLFNGRYGVMTDSTGLLLMRARYYSPLLRRFLNQDPAGFTGGLNVFAFANANPISNSDPFGLWSWRQTLGVLQAVGGAFEAGAGVALGVASSWTGVGAVAGGAVALHGADTFWAGVQTAYHGEQVDTYSSQGLQAAGLNRNTANLVDTGISVVATFGASSATSALSRSGGLVHLTDDATSVIINGSQQLISRSGNYVGPATLANAQGWGVTIRTGLNPGTYTAVQIPGTAVGAFSPVRAIGPISTWQAINGVAQTAPGTLNLTTGVLARTGLNWGQTIFYGIDALFTAGRFSGAY